MRDLSKTLKAVANERRLKILRALMAETELNVSEIAGRINLSFKSTSKHLILLERAGFVKYRNVALNSYYSINKNSNPHVQKLLKVIKES